MIEAADEPNFLVLNPNYMAFEICQSVALTHRHL